MLIMNNCSSWNKDKYKTAKEGEGEGEEQTRCFWLQSLNRGSENGRRRRKASEVSKRESNRSNYER